MSLSDDQFSRIMTVSPKDLEDPKTVRSILPGAGTSEANTLATQVLQLRAMVEDMKASESSRKLTWTIMVCTVVITLTGIANIVVAIYS